MPRAKKKVAKKKAVKKAPLRRKASYVPPREEREEPNLFTFIEEENIALRRDLYEHLGEEADTLHELLDNLAMRNRQFLADGIIRLVEVLGEHGVIPKGTVLFPPCPTCADKREHPEMDCEGHESDSSAEKP